MDTIYVRQTRAEVDAGIRKIPGICRGNPALAQEAVKHFLLRIGLTALARIKDAFITKARGGTDDTGLKWPPLAPSTIAYWRRHPGVPWPGSKRAPFAPSWMLTQRQRDRWWQVYRSAGGTSPKGRLYHARENNARYTPTQKNVSSSWAAAIAWNVLKSEGAETLIGKYGNTKVEILRDTGLLLNTLTPGIDHPQKVLRLGNGQIIIGTNRKWAGVHHKGNSRVPQRRLWPDPRYWTAGWWKDILGQARQGIIDIAKDIFA